MGIINIIPVVSLIFSVEKLCKQKKAEDLWYDRHNLKFHKSLIPLCDIVTLM